MFEKMRIKEHMEVSDCNGEHVGTVDHIQDDKIKLTKTDSMDGMHHFLSMNDVDKIAENRVWLKEGTNLPEGLGNKAMAK